MSAHSCSSARRRPYPTQPLAAQAPGGPPRDGFGPGDPGGAGTGGEPGEGVKLDPLRLANDPNKPLAAKLLAAPALRARYLGYVRDIAENWLDWSKLEPVARRYQQLIAEDIKRDTRKLDSTEDFEKSLTEDISSGGGFGPAVKISLKNFADQRREYLLNHPEIKNLAGSDQPKPRSSRGNEAQTSHTPRSDA